jgi:hypothetical protein
VKRAALCTLALAACWRGGGVQRPGDTEPDAADPLAFLPMDSEIVVGFDAVRLRGSALWREHGPQIIGQFRELERVKTACGFDLVQTITGVTVGFKQLPKDKLHGVVVVRGLDARRVAACLPKLDPDLMVTLDREVGLIHDSSGGSGAIPPGDVTGSPIIAAFTAVGADAVVFEIGPSPNRDALLGIVQAGAPLRKSPSLLATFGHVEHGVTMWGWVDGKSRVAKKLAREGFPASSVDTTLMLTDRMALVGRVALADATQATKFANKLTNDLAMGQGLLERLDATASGAVVTLHADATGPQVAFLLKLLR